jgi:hypothetical protein
LLISNREEIHQKIQPCANVYESEYAPRFALTAAADMSEEIFISRTDPNAKYTHIVTESDRI